MERGIGVVGSRDLPEFYQKLVNSSAGIVAFIHGDSRGTAHTVSRAIRRGIRVVAFPCGEGAVLPRVSGGIWRELRC